MRRRVSSTKAAGCPFEPPAQSWAQSLDCKASIWRFKSGRSYERCGQPLPTCLPGTSDETQSTYDTFREKRVTRRIPSIRLGVPVVTYGWSIR